MAYEEPTAPKPDAKVVVPASEQGITKKSKTGFRSRH